MIVEIMAPHGAREGEESLIRATAYQDQAPEAADIRAETEARALLWLLENRIQGRTFDWLLHLMTEANASRPLAPRDA